MDGRTYKEWLEAIVTCEEPETKQQFDQSQRGILRYYCLPTKAALMWKQRANVLRFQVHYPTHEKPLQVAHGRNLRNTNPMLFASAGCISTS